MMSLKVRKPTIHVNFKPFNFLVQQHENIKSTESITIKKYIVWFCLNGVLFGLE